MFFLFFFFFFNDTATTEIYTLSLHDALPISPQRGPSSAGVCDLPGFIEYRAGDPGGGGGGEVIGEPWHAGGGAAGDRGGDGGCVGRGQRLPPGRGGGAEMGQYGAGVGAEDLPGRGPCRP